MKSSILPVTIIGILFVTKAMAAYTNIPTEQLEGYKTATILAGRQSNLTNCTQSGELKENYLVTYLAKATSGRIDSEGSQPILIFESSPMPNETTKSIATVVSTSDYKKVISIKVEEFVLSDVNAGDLRSPNIQKRFALNASAECK